MLLLLMVLTCSHPFGIFNMLIPNLVISPYVDLMALRIQQVWGIRDGGHLDAPILISFCKRWYGY